jgi:2-polyprenyl-3-methyl-5-hydroxy-6-metoxy-1,4-benzoquinol methylase
MSGVKLKSNHCESGVPSAIQLESAPCPLGCAPNDAFVLEGRDQLHALDGDYKIMCCVGCGLKRTNPRPTPETIGYYYPDDYGPYKGTRVSGSAKPASGLLNKLLSMAKAVFDNKSMAVPKLKPGKMLEIGCASGSYLHTMAQKGWAVEGVEYSPSAAKAARALGYNVAVGALESVSKPSASYDLIVGWMVLEHLHQPVQSLQKLARWAAPGAHLVVSVPNAGSLEASLFGPRWYALHLPNHLYHYDPETVRKVLAEGGWEVEKIFHHRNVGNFIGSMGYWLRDHGFQRLGQALVRFPEAGGRLGTLLTFPLALPMAWLGQTGRMTVWAKRK